MTPIEREAILQDRLRIVQNENNMLRRFIQDGAAYLNHARKHKVPNSLVISTLRHDFNGLANNEACFLPRVSGYHMDDKVSGYKP
jgi:hypothetical protein